MGGFVVALLVPTSTPNANAAPAADAHVAGENACPVAVSALRVPGRKGNSAEPVAETEPRFPSWITRALESYCSRTSVKWLLVWSTVAVLAVGIADVMTGPRLSFSIFYLVPVSFAAWFIGRNAGLLSSALSAIVWLLAELASSEPRLER